MQQTYSPYSELQKSVIYFQSALLVKTFDSGIIRENVGLFAVVTKITPWACIPIVLKWYTRVQMYRVFGDFVLPASASAPAVTVKN